MKTVTKMDFGIMLVAGRAIIKGARGSIAADNSTYFDRVWAVREAMQDKRTKRRAKRAYVYRPMKTFNKRCDQSIFRHIGKLPLLSDSLKGN